MCSYDQDEDVAVAAAEVAAVAGSSKWYQVAPDVAAVVALVLLLLLLLLGRSQFPVARPVSEYVLGIWSGRLADWQCLKQQQ